MMLDVELEEMDRRIAVAKRELAEARQEVDAEVTRNVLGEPDGEALAEARALVAWSLDELNQLVHGRELLRHRLDTAE